MGGAMRSNQRTTVAREGQETNDLLEIIWPETGMYVNATVDARAKDELGEDDTIELSIDFVTLSLKPVEFIQLASALRMSVDNLLDLHPKFQRTVIEAFDVKS